MWRFCNEFTGNLPALRFVLYDCEERRLRNLMEPF